ncbi:MAG TPA: ribosomal-processing cysteine protease Prp [Candidatus Cybelea sp.]|nr:ribosomal-processing cysteine protease Prp [Candidatus Cybelea sp.]
MLEVTFYRDEHNRFAGISAYGHVDFAAHGQDIVCAAVSGILQAARLGLEHYAGGDLTAFQEAGEFDVMLDASRRDVESIQAILMTAELAITQVARRFPEHVSLAHERV